MSVLFIPCFGYAYRMDFYGFVDGASRHTLNLASAAWVLYSMEYDLVILGAVCIGPATKNIVEYQAVINLLTKVASRYIHDLVVFMDSQLVVFQLNHIYTVDVFVTLKCIQFYIFCIVPRCLFQKVFVM